VSNETCEPHNDGEGHQIDFATASGEGSTAEFVQMHNLQDLQPLCCSGLTPLLITGLIMRVLANHFANPALIMDPDLKQYVWSSDATLSKIRITPNTRFDPKNAGQMPALIIKRGDLQSQRKLMGDRMGVSNRETGAVDHVRFVSGNHRVFCIAETDGEAENIALEVFHTLTFLSPALVGLPYLMDFQVVGMGELGVLDGLGNRIGVPIDITYAYEDAWTIQPLAPRLKSLNIDIT
jgi:hypothetical protein